MYQFRFLINLNIMVLSIISEISGAISKSVVTLSMIKIISVKTNTTVVPTKRPTNAPSNLSMTMDRTPSVSFPSIILKTSLKTTKKNKKTNKKKKHKKSRVFNIHIGGPSRI